MKRTALAAIALTTLACSGEPLPPPDKPAATASGTTSAPATVAAEPPPSPPAFRMPDTVVPVKMAATLTVVPTEDTLRGTVEIDLSVAHPTRVIWLHANDLTVSEAHLDVAGGRRPARVVPGGEQFVGFVFDEDIPSGPAHLAVTYTGRVSSTDDRGVFREKEGGDTFLFTQFENVDARRAFPCFDEPSFKVPWQLTLRVKTSDTAISNTPVVEEKQGTDGFKTVRFAETKPLPSYLVAFGVGPFEMVDGGRGGKNKTPIRFAVPRGQAAQTAFAVGAAPKLMDLLEGSFGVPYPYEKLDFVIIPNLASFGAMENAGMITIASFAVLAKQGEDTPHQRNEIVSFMAHEMAHQWFGDLVTMAWWDDIWLNEGFATWMEQRTTHRFEPAFGEDLVMIARVADTMGQDGLMSARKVRQEILSYDDIANGFDGITYTKGGAVLGMFEAWLGEGAFQKGVRLYLDRFGQKNARSSDFLTALGEGSGKDVKAAFSTFLDQPGVPVVTSKLACDAGGAKLELSQERFLPLGSKGTANGATWQIPVCVRYGAGKASGRACTLLAGKTGELALPKLDGQKSACPDWVMPKENGVGYFRAAYTPKDVASLFDKGKAKLSAPERLNATLDVRALALNGRFPLGDALARMPELLKDENPHVQQAAANMAFFLTDDYVDADLSPNVRRFVKKVVAPRAHALGWQAKADDSAVTRRLRFNVLEVMIELGDDPKFFAEADALARKWLDDPKALDPDSVDPVLRAAATHGDKKLFDRMLGMVKTEQDSRRRDRLVGALASFTDPALAKAALGLMLDPAIDARWALGVIWSQPHANRTLVWDFLKEKFDALMARVPADARAYVLTSVGDMCDEAHRADIEAFMKDRAPKITGAPRVVSQTLERISLCIARRDAHKENLRAFLKKQ